ncbi:MAG: agmatine deiminase family protein [bacterium]|nr:agmatine deiminase family protein [bacterium]
MGFRHISVLIGAALIAAGVMAAESQPAFPSAAAPPVVAPESVEWDLEGREALLPHRETGAELEFRRDHGGLRPESELRNDPPPVAPVRNCAEWEPATGVLVRYPFGLPYALLRDFADEAILHVIAAAGAQAAATTALSGNGVDMARVQFLGQPSNSIWTRDYGPWFVFDGNGEIAIIDHEYNRPLRPSDDLIPLYFGQAYGIPVHTHSMYHTGGNYMTDGALFSASTDLVYSEAAVYNGMDNAAVDQLMLDYYGVENYSVVQDIEAGGIHHIDCWAKFLDEETVLVKQTAAGHYTYAALEQRATLLASLPSSTGRNYQVHRVYCYSLANTQPAAYTNSLILNDNIYVPFFGNATYDQQALEAYRAAAPGYNVRGYYYSGFLTDDALHCRAIGIMDRDMLRVAHVPVIADQPAGPVTVVAHIRAHGDQPLTATRLHYRHGAGAWASLEMTPTAAPHEFAAVIPAVSVIDSCSYYIQAEDGSGRTAAYPRVAPDQRIRFLHDGSALTPVPGAPAIAAAALLPNAPNPFNPRTTFAFELRDADSVELVVLDLRGRLVRTLIDGACPAGRTEVTWHGDDDDGRTVASGTYVYRLRAAGLQYSRTATLVK